MNNLVAWKINTAGVSDGLSIPSGFVVSCMINSQKSVNNGVDFAELEVQVCTCKDDTFSGVLNQNDDLMAQGFVSKGNVKSYTLVSADLDDSVRTMIKNKVRPDLDAAYGAENVVEL